MNINEIDERFERQARYRIGCQAKRRLHAMLIAVWWQGWDAAISQPLATKTRYGWLHRC